VKQLRVAILGCGPAGLFAAHAAYGLNAQVDILSKPRKSFMRGAQYLHQPIPGLSKEPFQIDYRLEGTTEGYRAKVYGEDSQVDVSPESLVGTHDAWDIREAYDAAWDLYRDDITPWEINEGQIGFPSSDYDLVLSTVPAKLLCQTQHYYDGSTAKCQFRSEKIWSTNYVKRFGVFADLDADNVVVCSGDPDDWWYRASRIHGWENTEFASDHRPPGNVWEVEKPIDNNCYCHPGIIRLGRYGTWTKGVLSHESFYKAEEAIIQTLERIS
jgi:hypothetical protein